MSKHRVKTLLEVYEMITCPLRTLDGKRCGHQWTPRLPDKWPKKCPKCFKWIEQRPE